MLLRQVFMASMSMLVGLVASQSSTLFFTNVPHNAQVGQVYTITYDAPQLTSPATIILRKGPSGNLQTISTLTTSATDGTFYWTPDPSLLDGGDYALEVTQGDQINYSFQFTVVGGRANYGSPPLYTGTAPILHTSSTLPGTSIGTGTGIGPVYPTGTGNVPGSSSGTGIWTATGTEPWTGTGHGTDVHSTLTLPPYGNGSSSAVYPTGTGIGTGGVGTISAGTGGTGGNTHASGSGAGVSASSPGHTGPAPSGFAAPFQASLGPIAMAMGAVGAVMHML